MEFSKKVFIHEAFWMFCWVVSLTCLIVVLIKQSFPALLAHNMNDFYVFVGLVVFIVFWAVAEFGRQYRHMKQHDCWDL